MIIDALQFFIGIAFVSGAFLFAYVSSVIVYENKSGKPYKMFWEKNNEDEQG